MPGLGEQIWVAVAESEYGSRSFALGDQRPTSAVSSLKAEEEEALQRAFGRMTPALFAAQRDLSPEDRIRVHFFLSAERERAPFPHEGFASKTQLEDWIRSGQAETRAELLVAKKRLRVAIEEAGATETTVTSGIPVVVADVPVWLLRSAVINTLPELVEIHADSASKTDQPTELLGYAAHASMNEPLFVGGGCGTDCDGDGLMVAILEQGCAANDNSQIICAGVASQNSRLNRHSTADYFYQQPLTPCSLDADCAVAATAPINGAVCRKPFTNSSTRYCVFDHSTGVAASIGMDGSYSYNGTSVFPIQTGNAPTSVTFGPSGAHNVYYALANSIDPVAAVNWIVDTMPTFFINRSQDQFVGTFAAALNWAARNRGIFYTQAGGNTNTSFIPPGTPTTTTCGLTRNGLCVGWYNYEGGANYNVLSAHSWVGSDPGSSYGNTDGLERPHLLGPGTVATTSMLLLLPTAKNEPNPTNESPSNPTTLTTMSGSSFAAPAVLSAQIQAMEYEGYFSAAGTPLASKAMILASTVDSNSDGAVGLSFRWSGQPGDAKDGAGQIDFSKLKQILDNNRYSALNLTNSSFVSCGTGCREYLVGTVTMSQSVRFALAWNACSTTRSVSAFLNNDLDLRIQRSAACGGSYESNDVLSEVELIQIAPSGSPSCTASIRIRIKGGGTLNSCGSSGTEAAAVAWAYQ